MATAIQVANYLVFLLSGSCDDLTNMKLNKLLYYAQGHSLKKYGHPIFDEAIEAWNHGPIVNEVYQRYKAYVDSPISEWDASLLGLLSDEEQELLMDVARTYTRFTASALRNMTHVPNGPWDKAYAPGESHIEIPLASIENYFKNREKPIEPIELNIDEDSFVGYRDSEGCLVLPKEWDDETV